MKATKLSKKPKGALFTLVGLLLLGILAWYLYYHICFCVWVPLHDALTDRAWISNEELRTYNRGIDTSDVWGEDGQYKVFMRQCPHGHTIWFGINTDVSRLQVSYKNK